MLTSVDLNAIQYTLGKWQVNRVWIGHNVASLFDWISSAACGIIAQRERAEIALPLELFIDFLNVFLDISIGASGLLLFHHPNRL